MYLLPILVPILLDGARPLVWTDWKRALGLLRDSLGGRYGDLVVSAPWFPADHQHGREQALEAIEPDSGIRLEPAIEGDVRRRRFWTSALRPYLARMSALVAQAQVVHSGVDDPLRPFTEIPLGMAVRRGLPTVFVRDTDGVVQHRALAGRALGRRVRAVAFTTVLDQVCRAAVARTDLSLLKGKALMKRYGRFARNPREFHDTSYLLAEMAPEDEIERRLVSLADQRPLRLVYCGRLVARKGVDRSIDLVARARARGAGVTLEVIGTGIEEEALRAQIAALGLSGAVTLVGGLPYGPPLLRRLATHDALLFTPGAEDTPRMIFDGYAAGLPLIAAGIPYVRERADEEHATLVLPDDAEDAAALLARLAADRTPLVPLTRAAIAAGKYHAADQWYARRAEWTHEAVEKARHRAG
jgi:glycosyltransferase involved in cell wall biosynthesis